MRLGSPAVEDYLAVNRANWDDRAAAHAASPGYAVQRLIADPRALSGVVEFDQALLGDVSGLDGIHLQCHIGTDTLSLHRLGARMTGLDFSPAALAQARRLAAAAGADIPFVEARVDDAVAVLGAERFDLVYTGIGALCWLPSIRDWAATVAALLRPGGRLVAYVTHRDTMESWPFARQGLHRLYDEAAMVGTLADAGFARDAIVVHSAPVARGVKGLWALASR